VSGTIPLPPLYVFVAWTGRSARTGLTCNPLVHFSMMTRMVVTFLGILMYYMIF